MGLGAGDRGWGQRLDYPGWWRGAQEGPEGLARCSSEGLRSRVGWEMSACTSAPPSHTLSHSSSVQHPGGGGKTWRRGRGYPGKGEGGLGRCRSRPPKPQRVCWGVGAGVEENIVDSV